MGDDYDEAELRGEIEDDWSRDARGCDTMDYEMFYDAIFELVDMWSDTTDVAEYATNLLMMVSAQV